MNGRAAVVIERVGPYHLARMRALGQRLGGRLHVIEVCASDKTYAWESVESGGPFERTTLFDAESSIGGAPRLWAAMSAALDSASPDVVATPGWGYPASLTALSWSRRRSCPAVIMSDSNEHDGKRRPAMETLKRLIVRSASAGFVAGAPQKRYLQRLGMASDQIVSGYDVVDNEHFAQGARRARSASAEVRRRLDLPASYFLYLGRFVEKKNLARLIDSYARLLTTAPAAPDLVLVGDGPLRPQLVEQVARRGLSRRAHFRPFAQYDAIPSHLGLARALVLPSVVDQWGLVVNEAMAAGVPPLVSERCGCVEDLVIDGQTGIRLDPLSIDSIANALSRVCDGVCAEPLGAAAQEHVASWTPETFAAGFLKAAEIAMQVTSPPSIASSLFLRSVASYQLKRSAAHPATV